MITTSASQEIEDNLIAKKPSLSRVDVLAPGSIDSKLATKLEGVMEHSRFILLNITFLGGGTPLPSPGGTVGRFDVHLEGCQDCNSNLIGCQHGWLLLEGIPVR